MHRKSCKLIFSNDHCGTVLPSVSPSSTSHAGLNRLLKLEQPVQSHKPLFLLSTSACTSLILFGVKRKIKACRPF